MQEKTEPQLCYRQVLKRIANVFLKTLGPIKNTLGFKTNPNCMIRKLKNKNHPLSNLIFLNPSTAKVYKVISRLKNTVSVAWGGIPSKILKASCHNISKPLPFLSNQSF